MDETYKAGVIAQLERIVEGLKSDKLQLSDCSYHIEAALLNGSTYKTGRAGVSVEFYDTALLNEHDRKGGRTL